MRKLLQLSLCAMLLFAASCEKNENLTGEDAPTAEAGAAQTVQAPVANVTLAGTGTSPNGAISGYLWSLVSGPNVPVIVSQSSATTQVTGLIPGTYLFQFAVIDVAGETGIDTTRVTVMPALQQTITLQPANNPNEMIFAVNGGEISHHSDALIAGAWTAGGNPFLLRGAVKFDMSAIPAGATILSAQLSLYSDPTPNGGNLNDANSGPNNAFYIRRILSNWAFGTSTWATQPATSTANQILMPHTSQTFLDLPNIDVTALVSQMHTSGNFGFMMMLQNESPFNIRQFGSSLHVQPDKRPKLVITYQ